MRDKLIAVVFFLITAAFSAAATPTVVRNVMGPNTACKPGSGLCTAAESGYANSTYPYRLYIPPTKAGNTLLIVVWSQTSTGATTPLTVQDSASDTFASLENLDDTTNNTGLSAYCASGIKAGSTWAQIYPTSASKSLYNTSMRVLELENTSCTVRNTNQQANQSGTSASTGNFTADDGDFVYAVFGSNVGGIASASFGTGYHGLNGDWWNGQASGWMDEYQVPASTGSINPNAIINTDGNGWEALGFALEPTSSSSGAGPNAFDILSISHQTYEVMSSPVSTWTFPFPVHGNLVVMEYDGIAVTGVSSTTLTWHRLGSTCAPNVAGQGGLWYAVASGVSENEVVSVTLASSQASYTAQDALIYDIQGADTASPFDTTIGTNGLACASGTQTTYAPTINFFSVTPASNTELLLFHANQDYNDGIGVTSPTGAYYLSQVVQNGGNFNYTIDQSAENAMCWGCSGEWTAEYNDAKGQAVGGYAGFLAGINSDPAGANSDPPGITSDPAPARSRPHRRR